MPKKKRNAAKRKLSDFEIQKKLQNIFKELTPVPIDGMGHIRRDDFYKQNGYQVIGKIDPDFFESDLIEFWKTYMKSHQARSLTDGGNNSNTKTGQKPTRKYKWPLFDQKIVDNKRKCPYIDKLKDFQKKVENLLPQRASFKFFMSLLFSYGNTGIVQLIHYDIKTPKKNDKLIWIPFEDGTTINIIPGSHLRDKMPTDTKPIKLLLNRGDVLIMHPFLLHAGDCFKEDNLRAHFYYVEREEDDIGAESVNVYPVGDFFTEYVSMCLEEVVRVNDRRIGRINHFQAKKEDQRKVDQKCEKMREAKANKNKEAKRKRENDSGAETDKKKRRI